MKVSTSKSHPRKQQSTISSTVVKCICITASCLVTACGLLGLGATCFVIRLVDPYAAPCPYLMTIVVFSVAGILFAASFVLLSMLWIRRNRMRCKAKLEDLPVGVELEEEEEVKVEVRSSGEILKDEEEVERMEEPVVNQEQGEVQSSQDNFEMTQKSADVSLWIEQQESTEVAVDCFPLENTDGATSHISDCENLETEITPL